jgi:hypothetical protein
MDGLGNDRRPDCQPRAADRSLDILLDQLTARGTALNTVRAPAMATEAVG